MLSSYITFFITGFLFIVLSIPLIFKKIKINNWYGIRLPQTMLNEKVWYEVNSKVGKYIFILGLIICLLSVLLYFYPFIDEVYTIFILLSALIMGSVILIILSIKYSNKYND
ncbi:MAG: SdpI family protein [Ignavibacteriae bacterium]|nr:SdpI family protein [Ignavibacteriota bacterium]